MPKMLEVTFVNIKGDVFDVSSMPQQKKRRSVVSDGSYHKGWRVIGHKPGECAGACAARPEEIRVANEQIRSGNLVKIPKPFDEVVWRQSARKWPVRSKPYELRDAAVVCADLATKAGWEDVEIVEVKKEAEQ